MGAWIEIHRGEDIETVYYVAPYMGAWIEMTKQNDYLRR